MTREEASAWMHGLKGFFSMRDINEALDVAISALRAPTREMVERMRGEWQVCFEDWRKQMAGDQCSKCGFQNYGPSNLYNFCPNCGIPMTDAAVDMVMERISEMEEMTNEH